MTYARLQELLLDTLVEVPYNSISHLFLYFGDKFPNYRFGTACVWQALELGKKLANAGCETVYYQLLRKFVH